MPETSSARILNLFLEILDQAVAAPPPRQTGAVGRKGLARRMILSVIDDVLRLDTDADDADWKASDVALLREKAGVALQVLNDAR